MTRITPAALARWRRDPIVFVREALIDPETGQPFAPSRPVVSGVLSNVAFVGCFVRFIIFGLRFADLP